MFSLHSNSHTSHFKRILAATLVHVGEISDDTQIALTRYAHEVRAWRLMSEQLKTAAERYITFAHRRPTTALVPCVATRSHTVLA